MTTPDTTLLPDLAPAERAFLLSEPRPCSDALGWLEREGFATLAEAWAACNRLGWLTWWLAFKAGLGVEALTWAGGPCVASEAAAFYAAE